ncbi:MULTISPECIES: DedA family protein [unclassified Sphingomonas]|jgi:membrane protein DedA with SNARE-associated domain|uniref:DedA family protein n=1 Tax=unclassified Sphingomonas TaxID=196159 RepID=UPI000829DB2E|nr:MULTISPECIES: DedA family protein [unclassified Sphingomonas]
MGDWIRELIEQSSYLGVFLLMLLETVFPPIPSEIIMSLSGLQAARGTMTLWGVILAGTAGAMLGNVLWYAFARWLGYDRFKPIIDRWGRWLTLDWREVKRADAFFDKYDHWFVFLGRMMPTIRSLVSIPAGLFEMPWREFLIWSTLGTLGWTTALAVAGYELGSRYAQVDEWLGPVSTGVIIAMVAYYVIRVFTWKPREE